MVETKPITGDRLTVQCANLTPVTTHLGDAYSTHFAAEKLEQAVSSVLIGYRLTLSGTRPVESTPWHRKDEMQPHSVRVRIGDDEVTLSVTGWGDQLDDVARSCAHGSASGSTSSARG